MTTEKRVLTRRALQLMQVDGIPLYLFTLTADEVLSIADISRISRDQRGELIGYQRQEVRKHVQEIADYLDGERPLFPNALILALSSEVRFTSQRGPKANDGHAVAGLLSIPLPATGEIRPGWIVDGQQRALALAKIRRRDLVIPISAFITDSTALQRDQFILVNRARPLSRRLVDELLPAIDAPLPPSLSPRQLPSKLVDALNQDDRSPFQGLIKRESSPATAEPRPIVTVTPLLEAIKESLKGGCLDLYRDHSGHYDQDAIWMTLLVYWSAVKDAFPEAWAKPPTQSRLMHGVGIRAMSRLMDRIMGSLNIADPETPSKVKADLDRLSAHCHWTAGRWEALDVPWDGFQYTNQDISELSRHLLQLYALGAK